MKILPSLIFGCGPHCSTNHNSESVTVDCCNSRVHLVCIEKFNNQCPACSKPIQNAELAQYIDEQENEDALDNAMLNDEDYSSPVCGPLGAIVTVALAIFIIGGIGGA